MMKKQLFFFRKLPCNCEVRGHCICKEMPFIPVYRVVDKKKIMGKKWRAEEEGHMGVRKTSDMMG
jgi:hypothetical protein